MNDNINWLVTILYNQELVRIAFQCKPKDLPPHVREHPMAIDSRAIIRNLLPHHIKSCGPIVDIEELFDVHTTKQ